MSDVDYALDPSTTVRDNLAMCGLQDILNLAGLTEVAINNPKIVWFDRGDGWESNA